MVFYWLMGLLVSSPVLKMPEWAEICPVLQFQSDLAICEDRHCSLRGHVRLRCTEWLFMASSLLVATEDGFSGAFPGNFSRLEIGGPVRWFMGPLVLNSARIDWQAEPLLIRSPRTEIRLFGEKIGPAGAMVEGVDKPRQQAFFSGDLEIDARKHFHLQRACLTTCDCPPGKHATWEIRSRHMEGVPERQRLMVSSPQLWLKLGRHAAPVTPPLFPLWLPLAPRALGFLFPDFHFYNSYWPQVDLPFFIPLGGQHDVTLTVGLRSDWLAPRGRIRWRYAPWQDTEGEWFANLTADISPHAPIDSRSLAYRLHLGGFHQSYWDMPGYPRAWHLWVLAHWLGDDAVLEDFSINPRERYATYLPSRGALTYQQTHMQAEVHADYILRLNSERLLQLPTGESILVPWLSNIEGSEKRTVNRGPWVMVQWLPRALGRHGGLWESKLNYARYGTWTGALAAVSQAPGDLAAPMQQVLRNQWQWTWARPLGPFFTQFRQTLDGMGLQSQLSEIENNPRYYYVATLMSLADVTLRWARHYRWVHHMVVPQLTLLTVPWNASNMGSDLLPPRMGLVDPYIRRRVHVQLMGSLRQLWFQQDSWDMRAAFGWPIDLLRFGSLEPYFDFSFKMHSMQLTAHMTLNPSNWGIVPELSGTWRWTISSLFEMNVRYQRYGPNAPSIERSLYELAPPPRLKLLPDSTPLLGTPFVVSNWSHGLQWGLFVRGGLAWRFQYNSDVQLPRPYSEGGEVACLPAGAADSIGRGSAPIACIVGHQLTVQYTSPCRCWGVHGSVSAAPQNFRESLRTQISFNIPGSLEYPFKY